MVYRQVGALDRCDPALCYDELTSDNDEVRGELRIALTPFPQLGSIVAGCGYKLTRVSSLSEVYNLIIFYSLGCLDCLNAHSSR